MMVMAISSFVSPSFSDTGYFIRQEMETTEKLLQESNILVAAKKEILQKLDEVFKECSLDGWDGLNAEHVSEGTLRIAKSFLKSFPLGIESPDVGAEPDGAITLEWYKSSNNVISFSINPDGTLSYAAIIGYKKKYGSDSACVPISEDLLRLIVQVMREIQ